MIAAVYVPCPTCNVIAIKDMKQEVVSCHAGAQLLSEKRSLHAVNALHSMGNLSRCFFFGAECQCKRNEKDLFIKLRRTGKHTHAHAAYALF